MSFRSDHKLPVTTLPTSPATLLQEKQEYIKSQPKPIFRSRSPPLWKRALSDTWLGEAIAMIFSVVCLVAITVVLRIYNGRTAPNMPYGLTLNAIVAVLATAAKSSLLFTVASTMGQLKWCWFTKTRRLKDIQSMDDASRGPLGSITMLTDRSFKPLASAGAVVIILALAFDPFVQQVLRYPTRPAQHPSALVKTGKASGFPVTYTDAAFIRAINAGVSSNIGTFDRNPPCPSGTCNWPRFQSLGWCGRCENSTLSARLVDCDLKRFMSSQSYDHISCTISLGHGLPGTLFSRHAPKVGDRNHTQATRQMTISREIVWSISNFTLLSNFTLSKGPTNQTFAGVHNPLVAVAHASLDYNEEENPASGLRIVHAEACSLTPCARTYDISTTDGVSNASVVETDYGEIRMRSLPLGWKNGLAAAWCWHADSGNIKYSQVGDYPLLENLRPTNSNFAFCPVSELRAPILSYITGNSSTSYARFLSSWNPFAYSDNPLAITGKSLLIQHSSVGMQSIATKGLNYVVESVAASLTMLALELDNKTVTGNVTTAEPYVLVQWTWLTLPFALEVTGIALFAATIVLSKRLQVQLWRSSTLPLLYHGLEEHKLPDFRVPASLSEMEELSRKTDVKLTSSNRVKYDISG